MIEYILLGILLLYLSLAMATFFWFEQSFPYKEFESWNWHKHRFNWIGFVIAVVLTLPIILIRYCWIAFVKFIVILMFIKKQV